METIPTFNTANPKSYEIKQYDGLNRTPAIRIGLEAWMALMEDGSCDDDLCLLQWDDQAVVAFLADQPVGIITWAKLDYMKTAVIRIGYVRPDERGNGVYDLMFNALVATARSLKFTTIEGGTRFENAPMRAVAKRQGRQEMGVILRYDILPLNAENN